MMFDPFPIVAITAVVEVLMQARWVPRYFRFGVKVFSRRIPLNSMDLKGFDCGEFDKEFRSGGFGDSLLFRRLSQDDVAFRERIFELSAFQSTPIMHGRIEFIVEERAMRVSGYLNWSIVAFAFAFLSTAASDWVFPVAFTAILLACYFLQARRYNRLCAALAVKYGTST